MKPMWFRYGWLGLCAAALVLVAARPAVAALGQDGDRTVVTREVVNHFAELAANAPLGSTRLQVSDLALLPGIKAGDVVFVIQMQGALLETQTDSARYGEVHFGGGEGQYEWLEVTGVDVAARTLQVRGQGLGSGLRFSYLVSGHTQIIQVPQYKGLTIASDGVLTAPEWNGGTGGVLVVTAETLRVDGTLDMTGKGFRGGRARMGGSAVAHGFRMTNAGLGAERGEGIGGFAAAFDLIGGRYGRGAAANGGGGGNARGAAGGGGANGSEEDRSWTGLGVMDVSTEGLRTAWRLDPNYGTVLERFADDAGGGRGGYGCSSAEADPLVLGPEMGAWGCGDRAAVGGLGGRPLLEEAPGHLFLGGGGGAGHSDEGDAGAGGAGGGLVFVLARSIEGEGRILADGAAGGDAGLNGRRGGPGGGGGGGTVVLMAPEGMSAVRVSAVGGGGGVHHAPESSSEASGGGGGGGGGVVVLLGDGEPQSSVAGGLAGTTTQPLLREMPTNGATSGGGGAIRRLPGFGPDLAPPIFAVDLHISLDLGPLVAPDYTFTRVYATVTNLGSERVENATVTFAFPPPLSGRPAEGTSGCEGSDSMLVCTIPGLEAGAEAVIAVEMSLPPAAFGAFTVRATASGGGFEAIPADNLEELPSKGPGSLQLRGGCSLADGSGAGLGAWGVLVFLLAAGGRRGRRVASGGRRLMGAWVLPLSFLVLLKAGAAGAVPTNNEAPKPVTASFVLGEYTVDTRVAGGQGSFSPKSATVADGDTTSFTVTPDTGYSVQSVTGCGGSLVGNIYTTAAVTGDCTVTATFVLNVYTVSTEVAGGLGSFSPKSATVAHGGTTSFTVTPDAGYSVQSVTGCGGSLVGNIYTTAAVSGDCTVTATFVLNAYTVSTEVAGGLGSFSPKSATVAHGGTTSFTVTPGTGYLVQSVTGCGGSLVGNIYTTDVVTGDCVITATFVGLVDSDNDGIDDDTEQKISLDPNDPDTDDDGIIDGEDGVTDTDGDGLIDALDPDSDNDGLKDGTERGVTLASASAGTNTSSPNFVPDADPSTTTNPKDADTDDGGLSDGTEDKNRNGRVDAGETNPLNASDDVAPVGDSDGDGLPDSLENATSTNPFDDDSDDDGLLDGNEDADHDGQVSPDETDPRKADSDGDGLQDGTEVGLTAPQGVGTDPTRFLEDADPSTTTAPLRADTDGGGVADGREDTNHNGRHDPGELDARNPSDDIDADGDGLDNTTEWELGLDPFDGDTDDDGVLDGADGLRDSDGDGLLGALDPDSDNDGMLDGTEVGVTLATASHWTDVHSAHFVPDGDPATLTDPLQADTDGDGLTDGEEDRDHDGVFNPEQGETRPTDPDTDKGGVSDGTEVRRGSDPLDGMDDQFISGGGCAATGNSLGASWLLLLLGLSLRRWGRSRGRLSGSALGGVALLGVLLAGSVQAQRLPGTSEAIDTQQYKPAPGPWDVLGLSSPRMAGHGEGNLGFSFSYAKDPLGSRMTDTGATASRILEYQATADVMAALSFCGRFELGLSLPVTFQRSAPRDSTPLSFLSEGGRGAGLGDVRLVSKMRLLSTEGGLHLGLLAPVLLPTAGGKALRGGSGVGLRPRLLAEWERGRVRLLANLGFNFQREESLYNLVVGNELAYGLGAEVSFSLGKHRLAADAMLAGARGLKSTTGVEARPLELMAAVKYHLTDALAVHVGAGPGLSRGYGTPVYRTFLGLLWTAGERNARRSPAAP